VGLSGGKVGMVADEASVEQSVRIILDTALGERVMEPDFGCRIQELVFAPLSATTYHLVAHQVKKALERWEPRIRVEDVTATGDPARRGVMLVSIAYVVRSKNQRRNLVYPFYLTQG
jgi:phage baseplate assembly protein W